MKLLMITGDRALAEGKRGAFYNTLEEFHKYWDRVDIVCPPIFNFQFSIFNFFKPQRSTLNAIRLFNNVYIHPSPWPLWLQPWWILKKGRQLYRENKFNLITVHEYPPFYNGIGARWLWSKIRIPYVLEIHHIPGYPKAADFKEWLYKITTRFFIKYDTAKAKAVRVVNQHQVPEFLIKAGVPREKIIYIPSFYIDLDTFKPVTDYQPAPLRTEGSASGLPITKQYDLIFVGRLAKNKGINLLLETMKLLVYKLKTENCKLLIVGDGPMLEDLKLQTTNYKLQTNIIFHGFAKDASEIVQLLNQSKVLIMSSYNEGGPRVVLEAMACGVPVLATRVGMVPDVIKDGESGGVIDWNPVDISQKALELLRDTSKYQKYRANGLEMASHFEKQAAIKNYAEKLQNL